MSLSPSNEIPDGEHLFRYCKPSAFPEGQTEIPVSIFMDREMSCDWRRHRPDPNTSFHIEEGRSVVIVITVCDQIKNPRNPKSKGRLEPEWKQEVVHDPVSAEDDPNHGENFAHSLIKGLKKGPIVTAIKENSDWFDKNQ